MRLCSTAPRTVEYQAAARGASATMMWVVNMIDDRRQASGARSCTTLRADEEVVTAWRTSGQASLLWMRGVTTSYRVDPLGEYIIGVAERGIFLLPRRSTSRRVGAGDLVVLDPGSCHQGSTTDGSGWHARLVVVELSRLRANLDLADRTDPAPAEPTPRRRAGSVARVPAAHRASAQRSSGCTETSPIPRPSTSSPP